MKKELRVNIKKILIIIILNLFMVNNVCAINGGLPAELEDVPWAVKIYGCGAALISDTHILTAAHCVVKLNADKIKPRGGGESALKKLKLLPSIKNIYIHPEYTNWNKKNIKTKYSDIAILELKTRVILNETIMPVNLPVSGEIDKALIQNKQSGVSIMGWGNSGELIPSTTKLKILNDIYLLPDPLSSYWSDVIIEDELYTDLYKNNDLVTTFETGDYLIAKNRLGQSCKGDSGGPMIELATNTIIGVSAHNMGQGCGSDKYFFYTDVSKHLDWILSVLAEDK